MLICIESVLWTQWQTLDLFAHIYIQLINSLRRSLILKQSCSKIILGCLRALGRAEKGKYCVSGKCNNRRIKTAPKRMTLPSKQCLQSFWKLQRLIWNETQTVSCLFRTSIMILCIDDPRPHPFLLYIKYVNASCSSQIHQWKLTAELLA